MSIKIPRRTAQNFGMAQKGRRRKGETSFGGSEVVVVIQKGYDGEGSVPYINKKDTKTRRKPILHFCSTPSSTRPTHKESDK